MMKHLDRSKPFGTVYGASGASYEQDGRLFDHEDRLIGSEPVVEPAADPVVEHKKPGRPKKVADPVDAQIESQMGN